MQIMNGFHYYYSKSSLSYDANKGVSWIDYDKLGNPIRVQFTDHSITEHVYAADGRNKEPHPNPLPRRGNSIISSHLPLGEIREGYRTIQQNTNYYPYGGMTSISTGQGEQQFKYNGKEYDPMHGLDLYDYGARHYDATIGQFTTMDPLCEKYYHINQIYEEGEQNPERTHKKFLLVRQEGNRSVRRQMSHYFSLRAKW